MAPCFDDECLMCVGGVACGVEEGSFYRCRAYLSNVCNNIDGSFECLCQDGFEKNSAGACVNVDECGDGTDTCFDATVDGFMSEIGTDAEILVAGNPKLALAQNTQHWSPMAVKAATNVIMSVTKVMPLRSLSTNTRSMMTSLTLAHVPLDSERKSLMHPLIQPLLMTTNVLTLMNANLTHALEMVLDAKTTPDHMNVTVISQELN